MTRRFGILLVLLLVSHVWAGNNFSAKRQAITWRQVAVSIAGTRALIQYRDGTQTWTTTNRVEYVRDVPEIRY